MLFRSNATGGGSTPQTKTVDIKFTDLIGQPTWVANNIIQTTVVMRGDVKIGDQITVSGYLARKGERMAIAGAVADASGRPLFEATPAEIGK